MSFDEIISLLKKAEQQVKPWHMKLPNVLACGYVNGELDAESMAIIDEDIILDPLVRRQIADKLRQVERTGQPAV